MVFDNYSMRVVLMYNVEDLRVSLLSLIKEEVFVWLGK